MEEFCEIEGIDEVCDLIVETPRKVIPGALLNGLRAGGQVIEDAIRVKMPIREKRSGGDAKFLPLVKDLKAIVVLDADIRGGIVYVGFSKALAWWIEYGHRMVSHGATVEDRKRNYEGMLLGDDVPPHPFMRPAVDGSLEKAADVMIEVLMAELTRGKLLDEQGSIEGAA